MKIILALKAGPCIISNYIHSLINAGGARAFPAGNLENLTIDVIAHFIQLRL